ncbi:uncharacterized protein LOC116250545 isoform X2 [Nymphaea colorata]|uniref:uncharacterized protein LOC116250545 isoform X2 n=1 Tax=Nymphaea colorata TaxID=210225 RepID=UPI00214E9C1D|nr:uncharacterized protein LOC116250545 isoform X2 [Nymphaea colorata]
MASPRTCTEMVEIGDLEADIREVGEVEEEQGEDKEEARDNGEVFLSCGDAAVVVMSEITPLLDSAIHAVQNPPKMNIFSVSYPRSRSKVKFYVSAGAGEQTSRVRFIFSLSVYAVDMEWIQVLWFPVYGSLFCWLLHHGAFTRDFFSIQRLQPAYAILLNFTTPIAASIFARVILQEKLAIVDIGGLSCSFLGALFIFSPVFSVNGVLPGTLDDTSTSGVNLNVYDVIIGIVSSLMGGISYCFIRAGAKASDQPVVTVFAFAVIATPFAALSASVFQEIVVPDVGSLILMIVLGILAFIAEVFLSRGLQIEKTSKVTNIQYIQIDYQQIAVRITQKVHVSFWATLSLFQGSTAMWRRRNSESTSSCIRKKKNDRTLLPQSWLSSTRSHGWLRASVKVSGGSRLHGVCLPYGKCCNVWAD